MGKAQRRHSKFVIESDATIVAPLIFAKISAEGGLSVSAYCRGPETTLYHRKVGGQFDGEKDISNRCYEMLYVVATPIGNLGDITCVRLKC